MLTLALFIPVGLVGVVAVGLCVGLMSASESEREADAALTYRNIIHRGGVTAPIPFTSTNARVNDPGLVEVHPQRTQPQPHTPSPSLPTALPLAASVANPINQGVSAVSEAPELPLELADSPNETEAEAVIERWENGLSMTKTIREVWDIRAGGGHRYQTARARYRHYLDEIAPS